MIKLWNRIPLTYRNAISHAAILFVVAFGSSLWALGLNHLTATAIIAAAVAAGRVVLARVMPGFPAEAKKPGATSGSH